jgi:hypothetical protein
MHAFDEELPHMPQAIAHARTRTHKHPTPPGTPLHDEQLPLMPQARRHVNRPVHRSDHRGYNVDYDTTDIINTLVTSPEYARAVQRERMRRLPFYDQLVELVAGPNYVPEPISQAEIIAISQQGGLV